MIGKKMQLVLLAISFLIHSCQRSSLTTNDLPSKPNIIILFADDAGYADFSFNGNKSIATPHIDHLAEKGVIFTNGYVSGPVCSPSRAGLMTGRYQQRFGHETNIGENYSNTDPELIGLPVEEKTIADLMKKQGYHTGMVGKWHLGEKKQFHPCNRGFDEFFGMLGGGSSYAAGTAKEILDNFEACDYKSLPYLTDAFGDKACEFIKRHQNEPFFLYLSFNAPHTPMHARADYLSEARQLFETEERAINAAMTRSLDENIGKVTALLQQLKLEENTLIFFTNDNGGAMPYNASCNDPFSGTKGTFLEGGVHVPFIATWKGVLPAGKTYDEPVISLDILPTAIALAGGELDDKIHYDGVNLMPYLLGEKAGKPHEKLFWRLFYHGAVRKGDWKLIWFDDRAPRLYNLKEDIAEQNDLSKMFPEKTAELLDEFHNWENELAVPIWETHSMWKNHTLDRYNQAYVDSLKRN
ncbi:sulfatase [Carboxylicivirga sediminis]|uniref:Sulfatase n=1 Tax=Carboxylicivirga sediminis TaxID=2006564 RepID=A0A941F8H1_9BACT|nr:sulfatase [Carboxylicivirga sediminis]MBR8538232.1 sulfatase [Carboxylicivirga sediminis]